MKNITFENYIKEVDRYAIKFDLTLPDIEHIKNCFNNGLAVNQVFR